MTTSIHRSQETKYAEPKPADTRTRCQRWFSCCCPKPKPKKKGKHIHQLTEWDFQYTMHARVKSAFAEAHNKG